MAEHNEIRFTEAELDAIADRICKRILINLSPEDHYSDHVWAHGKQADEKAAKGSARRVAEAVIGTTFTAALISFLVWLGHAVLTSWGIK